MISGFTFRKAEKYDTHFEIKYNKSVSNYFPPVCRQPRLTLAHGPWPSEKISGIRVPNLSCVNSAILGVIWSGASKETTSHGVIASGTSAMRAQRMYTSKLSYRGLGRLGHPASLARRGAGPALPCARPRDPLPAPITYPESPADFRPGNFKSL